MSAQAPPHVLSVDVEDWEQLTRRRFLGRLGPPTPRPVANTHTLLDLFARRGVRATFFVLGLIAEAHPALVREIAAAGHEVGTHGYSHRLVYELGPDTFRAELRRSMQLLSDITGQPVVSHRAAEFSITPRAPWAWEILAEEGIRYDSSIFPTRNPRYGIADAPRWPYRIDAGAGELLAEPSAGLLPAVGPGDALSPVLVARQLLQLAQLFDRPAWLERHVLEAYDLTRPRTRPPAEPASNDGRRRRACGHRGSTG